MLEYCFQGETIKTKEEKKLVGVKRLWVAASIGSAPMCHFYMW